MENVIVPFVMNESGNISIPIIMCSGPNEGIYFMLDSGADMCVIREDIYQKNKYCFQIVQCTGQITVGNGEVMESHQAATVINIGGLDYPVTFNVCQIPGLAAIEKAFGIKVHGVLGATFMKMFHWVIDFSEGQVICKR